VGHREEEPTEGEAQIMASPLRRGGEYNNVYSVGVTANKELRIVETINVAMTPRHPLGMTPSALALTARI